VLEVEKYVLMSASVGQVRIQFSLMSPALEDCSFSPLLPKALSVEWRVTKKLFVAK